MMKHQVIHRTFLVLSLCECSWYQGQAQNDDIALPVVCSSFAYLSDLGRHDAIIIQTCVEGSCDQVLWSHSCAKQW